MAGVDLNLSGAVRRTNKGSVDFYYGGGDEAWANLAAAYAGIPSVIRNGKVFGVITAGVISEYWWNDATALADGDEIPYAQGGTTLTPDQVDAINNANSPNSGNPFATMADILAGVVYQGVWNATTNTPTLTSSVGTQGYYYVVSVAGTTNLNGITDWEIGDWAIFNGAVWQKVDNTDVTGGNTNITSINVAALQALQTGSTISTTTFYNVTNAVGSTRVLQVYAIANNTNIVWAVDVTTGEIGTYDITGDVFVATGVAWGNITGNIEDQTDVGARADTLSNIFIGAGNNSNSITTSNQNLFYQNADANTLLDSSFCQFGTNSQSNDLNTCTNIVIGVESNGNLMLNAESYKIGNCSSNCEIDGGSNNIIGDYCSVIKLDKTTNCVFGNFVINFDNTTFPSTSFTLCAIATGLDFTGVDFTAATQLFGRVNYWSINKVLGTNLIEVTLDTNLPTAQTGQYDTSTDTFTPYASTYSPTITPDGSICTAAALAADAIYSVSNGVMKLMIPIDCTFDFTSNGAIIDYTLPFGSIASSGGNVTFNLNPNSPSLPISGYEKNGQIVVTTKDTAFNDDLTIYATITIKLA